MSRPAPLVRGLLAAVAVLALLPSAAFADTTSLRAVRSVTVAAPAVARVDVTVPCRAGVATVMTRGSRAGRSRVRRGRARTRVALPSAGSHRLVIRASRLKHCRAGRARLGARVRVRVRGGAGPATAPPLASRAAESAPVTSPAPAGNPAPLPAPATPGGTGAVPLGAALTLNNMTDAYRSTFLANFDSLTPENEMKMDTVHPSASAWNFGPGDELVRLAADNGKLIRGHTLLWDQQIPRWVRDQAWSRDEWRAYARDYIHTVVGHYRGKVPVWDVVNEPIDDTTGGLKDTFWLQKLGSGYVADALRWAREADPDAKLFVNDYSVEKFNRKSDALYALARDLRAAGLPLDGVGFQAHVQTTWYPSQTELELNLKRFADLGLRVEVTEADVRTDDMGSGATAAGRDDALTAVYSGMARACANTPACDRFTVWGIDDSGSWLGAGAEPLLFDSGQQPKPAYAATRVALRRA